MAWIWTKMAALYGARVWADHAPESLQDDWAAELANRNRDDIRRALEKCRRAKETFPPGAAEFNRRCAEYQGGTFAGARAPEVEEGALIGHDRANAKAEAAEAIRRIRERLANQKPAEKMAQTIVARMNLLHESRAEAIAYLRQHPVRWLADLDSDERIEALAVLDEHVTEIQP